MRREAISQLGGEPTPRQLRLINDLAEMRLIQTFYAAQTKNLDMRAYSALLVSIARVERQLFDVSSKAEVEPGPSLAELLVADEAERRARTAA
jgi:hypothetical protein